MKVEARSARAQEIMAILKSRDAALNGQRPEIALSPYWEEFVAKFAYVYELSDESLKFIRHHTLHLTSDNYQRYILSSNADRNAITEGYEYFIGELGRFECGEDQYGIGYDTSEGKVSWDLNRYLGVTLDLVRSRALVRGGHKKIMEIGAGYGGLARLLVKYDPTISYLICDLEEVLLFSSVYLSNNFDSERVIINPALKQLSLSPGTFYLVPQYKLSEISCDIDVLVNHQSMQEMTAKQVDRYLSFARKHCALFYSRNLDHHSSEMVLAKTIVSDLNSRILAWFPDEFWRGSESETIRSYGDQSLQRFVVYCNGPGRHIDPVVLKDHVRRLSSENARLVRLRNELMNISAKRTLEDSQRFIDGVPLSTSAVRQRFIASQDGLNALRLKIVTWGRTMLKAGLVWRLYRLLPSEELLVTDGNLDLRNVSDWGSVELLFSRMDRSAGGMFALELEGSENRQMLGVPIFERAASSSDDEYISVSGNEKKQHCIALELIFSR